MKNKSVLLDTSVIVDFLRVKHKENTPFYKLVSKDYTTFASIISHTELYAGKSIWERPEAREKLEAVFDNISLISLTTSISMVAGKLRALNGLPTLDAIIAATALEEKLPLATLNIKDFSAVEHLKLLKM